MPKGKKYGGRKKGTPNVNKFSGRELAQKLGVDPLEVLLRFAANDEKGLGYQPRTKIVNGQEVPWPHIDPELRARCASEASEYLYTKYKSVEITDQNGDNPLKSLTELIKEMVKDERKK